MNQRLMRALAAFASVSSLGACAYMDFAGGAYESIRSRQSSSQAASPGGVQQALPKYDDYERERAKLRSSPAPASTSPPAVPASGSAK